MNKHEPYRDPTRPKGWNREMQRRFQHKRSRSKPLRIIGSKAQASMKRGRVKIFAMLQRGTGGSVQLEKVVSAMRQHMLARTSKVLTGLDRFIKKLRHRFSNNFSLKLNKRGI